MNEHESGTEGLNRLEEDRELLRDLEEIVEQSPDWLRNSTGIDQLLESRRRALEQKRAESRAATDD